MFTISARDSSLTHQYNFISPGCQAEDDKALQLEGTAAHLICSFHSPWVPPGIKLGNEGNLGDFIEGLGPSQMVGRQVLGKCALVCYV